MAQTNTSGTPLSDALRNAKRGFVLAAVFSAFLNLLMLTTPIYMLQVFDRVLTTGHSDTLIALTVIVAIALAVLGTLEAVRLLLLSRTASWINGRLG
ncbi:MAG: type I secretion system permease/ATPase, partial [Leptolyngbya sp. SIO1D8]|nr:type I secretion system permease/ATPase [Leptolyngbya sp. SIO1D8]